MREWISLHSRQSSVRSFPLYMYIYIYICSSIIIGFFFYFYGCIHFSLIDPGGFIHFYLKGVGWVELVQVNSSG